MSRLRVEVYTDQVELIFSEWVEIPEKEKALQPVSALLEAVSAALFRIRVVETGEQQPDKDT